MTSSLSARLSLALVSLGSAAVFAPSASALCGEPAPRWKPEFSWPAACEIDVAVDGFVLLEGEPLERGVPGGEGTLEVKIERMVGGAPVETFAGKVTHPDETSALFKSERPLVPNADYVVTAERRTSDGQRVGAPFTSAFTTGAASLSPLRFRKAPSVQLESGERELHDCVPDACGVEQCRPTGETAYGQLLRVAVPAVDGGIALKPVSIDARLTLTSAPAQAPVVASAGAIAMQAGQRSFAVIDVPELADDGEGCVTVTATDAAGHTVTSEPVCLAIPASSAAKSQQPDDDATPEALAFSVDEDEATAADGVQVADSAGGCSVAGDGARAQAGLLAWLGLAIAIGRVRSRRRAR